MNDCCNDKKTGISRRNLLRMGLTAGMGYLLNPTMRSLFALEASAAPAAALKAQHLILLWMNGGPSHIDSFDPKSGKSGGSFGQIGTSAPGVKFTQHLPRLAEAAKDLVVVRGMTSREGSHGRAMFLMHTGYIPNPSVKYPSLGAIVSHEKGKKDFDLPNFVSLGGPSEGAGFFGPQHAPFVVRAKPGQPIENLKYFKKVDAARFEERLKLVEFLDKGFAARGAAAEAAAHEDVLKKATRMIQSPLVKAFELDSEPAATKSAYGSSDFGQRCLMARRLVEAGVPAVEVELGGWDTHENNFGRSAKLLSALDPAFAQLIADLKQRNLFDKTLIVCMGEFGRTPGINAKEGRDHHARAFSAVLAGGALKTGRAVGATDDQGKEVVGTKIEVPDLFATIQTAMGIDPTKVYTANDRPIALANKGKVIKEIIG